VSSSIVDTDFRDRTVEIDERGLMAFAAGAGDARPELVDTARAGGIIAHPVFPVAIEWLSLQDVHAELRQRGLGRDQALLASPLDYDLGWHRRIRPGDVLQVHVSVTAAQSTPDGVALTVESSTCDRTGAAVTRSRSHLLFPDAELAGRARCEPGRPARRRAAGTGAGRRGARRGAEGVVVDLRSEWSNADAVIRRGRRRMGAPAAHVFSECSGIWNPVFTDKAVALRHGRAFLAMPPAGVLAMAVGGALQLGSVEPAAVRRVHAEFGAPVPVPSVLEIEAEVPNHPSASEPLRFRAYLQDGTPAITAGLLATDPVVAGTDADLVRARAQAERRRRLARVPGRRAIAP
jgi:acyl dehydratase